MSSSSHFFRDLPLEINVKILKKLSLRDILHLWATNTEFRPIINSYRELLTELGVLTFDEFIERTMALPDEGMVKQVLHEGLPISTAELLTKSPEDRIASIMSTEQVDTFVDVIRQRGYPDYSREEFILGYGTHNPFVIGVHEGLITLEECIKRKVLVPNINGGWQQSARYEFLRSKEGQTALRKKWISSNELELLDFMDTRLFNIWRKFWLKTHFSALPRRKRFLSNPKHWKEVGAANRGEFEKFFCALPCDFQLLAIDNMASVATLEKCAKILLDFFGSDNRNLLPFAGAAPEFLLTHPLFNLSRDEEFFISEPTTLGRWSFKNCLTTLVNGNEMYFCIALMSKLISISDLKTVYDVSDSPELFMHESPMRTLFKTRKGLRALHSGSIKITDFCPPSGFSKLDGFQFKKFLENDCAKRHEFLEDPKNWKNFGADSKEDFRRRVNNLPMEYQLKMMGGLLTLDAAEKGNQLFTERKNDESSRYSLKYILLFATPLLREELLFLATQGPEIFEQKIEELAKRFNAPDRRAMIQSAPRPTPSIDDVD